MSNRRLKNIFSMDDDPGTLSMMRAVLKVEDIANTSQKYIRASIEQNFMHKLPLLGREKSIFCWILERISGANQILPWSEAQDQEDELPSQEIKDKLILLRKEVKSCQVYWRQPVNTEVT